MLLKHFQGLIQLPVPQILLYVILNLLCLYLALHSIFKYNQTYKLSYYKLIN